MGLMVVFTLKCVCTIMITEGFNPKHALGTVWNVVKAVRDALAHEVWPRGYSSTQIRTEFLLGTRSAAASLWKDAESQAAQRS